MNGNNTTNTEGPDSVLGRARKVIDDLDLWDALRELCDEEDAAEFLGVPRSYRTGEAARTRRLSASRQVR